MPTYEVRLYLKCKEFSKLFNDKIKVNFKYFVQA